MPDIHFSITDLITFKKYQDKQIVIFGLGVEGLSTYNLIRQALPMAEITLLDQKSLSEIEQSNPELAERWRQQTSVDAKVRFLKLSLSRSLDFSPDKTILIVSPGISNTKLHQEYRISNDIPVTTNAQLFFEAVDELRSLVPYQVQTIGITGTKGKSTTTAAIHHLLSESRYPSFLGGNIGTAPLNLLKELDTFLHERKEAQRRHQLKQDTLFFVLELSSHQLSRLSISPDIAVVLDITPEHLDYYATFDEYLEAKSALTRYQTSDSQVFFQKESQTATQLAELSPGTKTGYSLADFPLTADQLKVVGKHTRLNLVPAWLLSQQLGIPAQTAQQALAKFPGLPDRLEHVAESDSLMYINDSLATTPEATRAALESFEQPMVLIAGGYDRDLDYSELAENLAHRLTTGQLLGLVLFPPTGQRIFELLQPLLDEQHLNKVMIVEDMLTAVTSARELALKTPTQEKVVVLLSPAAASFGRFQNYADRSRQFKQAIAELEKK